MSKTIEGGAKEFYKDPTLLPCLGHTPIKTKNMYKTIEETKRETIECNIGHTLEDLYDDAFEDGKNYQREIDKEMMPNWISVNDRLPYEYTEVVVLCLDFTNYIAFIGTGGLWYDCNDACKVVGVTHWIPFPELPKTE